MKIFLYEFVTGGGCLDSQGIDAPPESLVREGRAMVQSLANDLKSIADAEVNLSSDPRYPIDAVGCEVVPVTSSDQAAAIFNDFASTADWTLVIAPESEGHLTDLCRRVEVAGGRLLGPGVPLVALCSDKHASAAHLAATGTPVPQGISLEKGSTLPTAFPFPAVVKPRDGCGSMGVQRISDPFEAAEFGPVPWPARLELFQKGLPASVAVLAGPKQLCPLAPCRQHLSSDGRFQYLGGSLPLEAGLARRATELAVRAVASLPDPRGYIGVDMVLGSTPADDCVIEINPRLTTSYVGLRAACRGNLAEAMLRIAQGEPAELSFRDDPLQFDADGTVRFLQGQT